jgi:Glycosyl transferases group 1
MRIILVATDAWHPQVNGVVRTLTMMADAARALGVEVCFLIPQSFRTKVVVGDGPARDALARKYPKAVFPGARQGEELAKIYAAADVFVFPSKTDTFGLVLLEALASGLPVAAFPVTGPRDVIGAAAVGALNDDLRAACLSASTISPQACREFAARHGKRQPALSSKT